MDEKYLEALEFDKIRARAADGIVCPEARGMLLGQPAWETPDEVRAALEQTDVMTTLLIKKRFAPFFLGGECAGYRAESGKGRRALHGGAAYGGGHTAQLP